MAGLGPGGKCCCGCVGLGVPALKTWSKKRGLWEDAQVYTVGDLARVLSTQTWHVCKLDHTAEAGTNDPTTDTGNTWWEDAERQLKCMYVELAGIGLADCRIAYDRFKQTYDTGSRSAVRLVEPAGAGPLLYEKVLLTQKKFGEHTDIEDGLLSYGGDAGEACHWLSRCNCSAGKPAVFTLTQSDVVGRVYNRVYFDSYKTQYVIQVNVLSATSIEAVVLAISYATMSDVLHEAVTKQLNLIPTFADVPCFARAGWQGSVTGFISWAQHTRQAEVFRGTATIPAGWIDGDGEVTQDLVFANDYACSQIDDYLGGGPAGGNKLLPAVPGVIVVGGGGGTLTIKSPFTDPWTRGDLTTSCTAIASPNNTLCDPEQPPGPPGPPWPPPGPPGPGPGPRPGPAPGPGPGPKFKWRKVNRCSGGFTGFWVPAGYPLGTVLLVELYAGAPAVCVVIGQLKVSAAPPGKLLPGGRVISNYGLRGCAECVRCWKIVGCPGSGLGTVFTDVDLSMWEGSVVTVSYTDTLGWLTPELCGTVSKTTDCPQTEFVIAFGNLDGCDDPFCVGEPCTDCTGVQPVPVVTVDLTPACITFPATTCLDCILSDPEDSPFGWNAYSTPAGQCRWVWGSLLDDWQIIVTYSTGPKVWDVELSNSLGDEYSITAVANALACRDGTITGTVSLPPAQPTCLASTCLEDPPGTFIPCPDAVITFG